MSEWSEEYGKSDVYQRFWRRAGREEVKRLADEIKAVPIPPSSSRRRKSP